MSPRAEKESRYQSEKHVAYKPIHISVIEYIAIVCIGMAALHRC